MTDMTVDTPELESTALVATEKAGRYLQQLCKHFAHKTEVAFDAQNGRIAFTGGTCLLAAEDGGLRLTVTAPTTDGLEKLQDVAARHLIRFAFREDLKVTWQQV